MTFIGPDDNDFSFLSSQEQFKKTVNSTQISAVQAANVTALKRTYNNISPGLATALGRSGIGPGAFAESLWQKDLATRINSEPGTKLSTNNRAVKTDKDIYDPVALLEKAHRYINYNNPNVKEGKFSQRLQDFLAQATPDEVQRFGEQAGLPQSSSKESDYTIDSLIAGIKGTQKYQAGVAKRHEIAANSGGLVGDITRTGLRYGFAGLQTGQEAVAAFARERAREGQASPGFHGVAVPVAEAIGGNKVNVKNAEPGDWSDFSKQFTLYQNVVNGKSMGEGIFPDPQSAAGLAQAKAARKFSPYTIGGHAWTPGRAIANTVFDPDTVPFDLASGFVDWKVATKLDPANTLMSFSSEARAAHKTIVADEYANAGIALGHRGFWEPKRFSAWVQGETGGPGKVITEATNETSPAQIWRKSDGKIQFYHPDGTPFAAAIADTRTETQTIDALRPFMGQGLEIENTLKMSGKPTARIWSDTPGKEIAFGADAHDLNHTAQQIEDTLVNAHVPMLRRDEILNKLARAGNAPDKQRAIDEAVFDAIAEQYKYHGLPDYLREPAGEIDALETAAKAQGKTLSISDLPEHLQQPYADMHLYKNKSIPSTFIEEAKRQALLDWDNLQQAQMESIGSMPTQLPLFMVDGEAYAAPHIADERTLLNNIVQMPDPQQIKRDLSPIAEIINHPAFNKSVNTLDMIMRGLKQSWLIRPATALRVVMEEQFRIAATGNVSFANHPLTAMTYALGNPDNRWLEKLNNHAITRPAGAALSAAEHLVGRRPWDLTGIPADDDLFRLGLYETQRFQDVASKITKGKAVFYTQATRDDARYGQGLGQQISLLREGRVYSSLAKDGVAATKERLLTGDLRNLHLQVPGVSISSYNPSREELVDAAIDQASHQIDLVTGSNPKLLEAIATGQIDGTTILRYNGKVSRQATKRFNELAADSTINLPENTRVIDNAVLRGKQFLQDDTLNYLMEAILTRPSNFFSRNTYLSQAYADGIKETFPYLVAADRAKIMANLRAANMGKKFNTELEILNKQVAAREASMADVNTNLFRRPSEYAPTLSLDAAEMIAKERAVNSTKDLLYDLSRKGQMMDTLRLVFPFGEAFKEVATRWAKITWDNPQVIRRFQQGVYAARQPGSGVLGQLAGLPRDPKRGFWYKDQFGTESFAFPGGQFLGQGVGALGQAIGLPMLPESVPLKGSVQGLNLIGSGIPGLSPMAQIPLSYMIPDKPQFQDFRKLVFPFGNLKGQNPLDRFVASAEPSWLKNIQHAVFSSETMDNAYASAVADTMAVNLSTGDYQLQGPNAVAEKNRLLEDSKKQAKTLALVMAMGAATLPANPHAEWVVEDKNGKLAMMFALRNWYYDRVNQYQKAGSDNAPQDASADFLKKFGTENFLLLQPKSKSLIPAGPSHTVAWDWIRDHPQVKSKYPKTFALWAGDPQAGNISVEAMQSETEAQRRKRYTTEEMLNLANARLAQMVYDRERMALGPSITADEAAQLRQLRGELTRQFPGYQVEQSQYPQREGLIEELTQASKDPLLRKTEAGKGLRTYLHYRDQALKAAEGPLAGDDDASIRKWLNQWGEYLVDRYPKFQPMFDSVFASEVQD